MAMGDLVLLESEINSVMLKMIASGLEITAVHNHLLRASPATFYMHVAGHGDPVKMATAIREALAESKTPLSVTTPTTPPSAVDLDTAQLDQIIGVKGQANGGVYQFNVPRRDPITEEGMLLSPVGPMGVAIGINFQPTGGGKAAITGDFVLTGDEVNPVIMALRANGIDVTALHSHCWTNSPGSSSCISGPTTTPSSWPRGFARRSTRRPARKADGRKGRCDRSLSEHGAGRRQCDLLCHKLGRRRDFKRAHRRADTREAVRHAANG